MQDALEKGGREIGRRRGKMALGKAGPGGIKGEIFTTLV